MSREETWESYEGEPFGDTGFGDTNGKLEDTLHNFSLGVLPSTIISNGTGFHETTIETDRYNLSVDWSQQGWVDYRIEPRFTEDFVRYRRANPSQPTMGTVDEYGNPLNDVDMTVAYWDIKGNVAWFVESCPEFSLNQTFRFFRDYMELEVTYYPGTRNVQTTYFIALYSSSGKLYDMFDGGYHRYMPGADEQLPRSHGMGGWYPSYKMYAPAMDMRIPYGNMGVEWGFSDTVAYLFSPIWMEDFGGGGASAFSVKYTSLNSIVPNVGLGLPETFHMFIRPYQYDDGRDMGYDAGYARWVSEKITSEWGYHDTSIFPLTVMNYGSWSDEFKYWVGSSKVKLATYTDNPQQYDFNYGSAWQRNRVPTNDPGVIPDDWELWGPGNKPQFASDGDVILNPVSGTYKDVGTFRHHLIEDNPYNDWWWGSDAVFWDEMNVYTPDVKPRNDYHNRSEFVYEGYMRLIQESYESGHWDFTIANPYTALLHLSMVSDLTVFESYRSSTFCGVDFVSNVHSTMKFVNNIPEEYRPNILVYQYYDATNSPEDQEDVYRFLFGSARYKFHAALVSWSDQSHQIHNLVMAEKMYLALGASRDEGVQIEAETLDLDIGGSVSTESRAIVWTGDRFIPEISLTGQESSYNFTNLRGGQTPLGVSFNTNFYYHPNKPSLNGKMTYFADGRAWFNGTLEAEETEYISRVDLFKVNHLESGGAVVDFLELSRTGAEFELTSTQGKTLFTIGGLLPDTEFILHLDSSNSMTLYSNASGHVSFEILPNGTQTIILELNSNAPVTDLSIGNPKYIESGSLHITNSTLISLTAYDGKGTGINFTNYRVFDHGMWTDWIVYNGPFTIKSYDGLKVLEFFSVGNDGAIERTKQSEFKLDNTPPSTNISINQPRYGYNPVYVTGVSGISLAAVDESSGVARSWFKIDAGGSTSYSGTFNLSSYRGMHVLSYSSVDNLGNNETPREVWVYVDDVPPVSIIQVGEPSVSHDGKMYISYSTRFSMNLSDEGSGSESLWYRIDGGGWVHYNSEFTISQEGNHRIHYNSSDNLGNHEATKTLEVTVDNTDPVADAGQDREIERGELLTFSGVLSFDNTHISNYTWTFNGTVLYGSGPSHIFKKVGDYLITLTVMDVLGRVDTDTLLVRVSDTIPPSRPIGLVVEPGERGILLIKWDHNSEDDLTGYIVYRSTSTGGPYVRISGKIVTQNLYIDSGLPDGQTFYYVVTAVDDTGNECQFSNEVEGTTVDDMMNESTDILPYVLIPVALVSFGSLMMIVYVRRKRRNRGNAGEVKG